MCSIMCINLFLLPASLDELYAFNYTAPDHDSMGGGGGGGRREGWDLFDLKSEYLRMGVPNDQWVLSRINEKYEVRTASGVVTSVSSL